MNPPYCEPRFVNSDVTVTNHSGISHSQIDAVIISVSVSESYNGYAQVDETMVYDDIDEGPHVRPRRREGRTHNQNISAVTESTTSSSSGTDYAEIDNTFNSPANGRNCNRYFQILLKC